MKKIIILSLATVGILLFASCASIKTPTPPTNYNTTSTSSLTTAGEQMGEAIKYFINQKQTKGKINFEDPSTYLQVATIVQNAKIIKENYKNKELYTAFANGLINKSSNIINQNNVDSVINTLVEKVANNDITQKAQASITNTQNWISKNQDTINAINILLDTLK